MKRPSFQFYPGDWRTDTALRRCTDAARGAWMDVLCVLHDSNEYGVVRFPLKEVAIVSGVAMRLLRELVAKGVLRGGDANVEAYVHTPRHAGKDGEPVELLAACEGPCWYSARFLKDEWRRSRRGEGTRFDTENQPNREPKATPTRPVGDATGDRSGDGPPASASASSSNPPDSYERTGTPVFALEGVLEGHENPKPGPSADTRALARALGAAGYECFAYDENLTAYIAEGGNEQHLLAAAQLPRCRKAGSAGYVISTARGLLKQQASDAPEGVLRETDRRLTGFDAARAAFDRNRATDADDERVDAHFIG